MFHVSFSEVLYISTRWTGWYAVYVVYVVYACKYLVLDCKRLCFFMQTSKNLHKKTFHTSKTYLFSIWPYDVETYVLQSNKTKLLCKDKIENVIKKFSLFKI